MRTLTFGSRFVIIWSSLVSATLQAADPIGWMPAEINTIARINVSDAFKSPLARKEGWQKKASEAFVHQDSIVPPGTKQILIGADLELADHLSVRQKYGVIVPDGDLTLKSLADWLPGGIEQVANHDAAQFHDGSYVIDTGTGVWLSLEGTRQAISRWLNRGPEKGTTHFSSYLQSALTAKVNSAPIMLAIDLQDNFSRDRILATLKQTDWFPSATAAERVADVLATAYGITINITFDKERTGHVALDFGQDATPLMPVLNQLVEAIMQRVGVSPEEFQDWNWSVKGSRVTGTGPVSPGGARRMISILDPPAVTQTISAASAPPPETMDEKIAQTSLKYCKSLQVLLDDVRKSLSQTRDNRALIVERYARKIDDLPKLYVDDDLLQYGANVSNSLRYQGQTMRMANIRSGTRKLEAGVNYTSFNSYVGVGGYAGPYGGYVGPYGSFQYTSTNPQGEATIDAQEKAGASQIRFSEWKQIEDGLVAIRTQMTKKYMLEF